MKNSTIKLIFWLVLISAPIGAQTQWELSGMLSRGLTAAAAVTVDSVVYVLGGYSDSVQSGVDWIQKFNPETGKFLPVARMKVRRHYLTAGVSGKYIYYTGGEYRGNYHSYGILERFDTETYEVIAVDSNKKFNRYAMTSVIDDSMMYFIGGDSYGSEPGGGNQRPYIIEYNLNKKNITYNYTGLFSGNHMRSGQMSRLIDKYIYIFGGAYNTVLADVYRYDRVAKKLTRIFPNMLVPRAFGSAVVPYSSGEFLLTGGFNEGSFALNTVERFRLSDSTNINNTNIASLGYRRKNHMSVLYRGYIYIFGGTGEFNQYVKQIERLQILTGTGDDEPKAEQSAYLLGQNYPNPFNPATAFTVSIPTESDVSVAVYSVTGALIDILDAGVKQAGSYQYTWNASGMPSGIYFCELTARPVYTSSGQAAAIKQRRKLLLLK